MSFGGIITRSKTPLFALSLFLGDPHLLRLVPIITTEHSSSSSSSSSKPYVTVTNSISREAALTSGLRRCYYHDGRPRGPLWRGKKLIGKEALFVISGLKRFKDDEEKLSKFIKTHVSRLLKMDLISALNELGRQQEVTLALKVFLYSNFISSSSSSSSAQVCLTYYVIDKYQQKLKRKFYRTAITPTMRDRVLGN
ncbi:hypothetical protein ACSBR1_041966 [Camellia fascicularis]